MLTLLSFVKWVKLVKTGVLWLWVGCSGYVGGDGGSGGSGGSG